MSRLRDDSFDPSLYRYLADDGVDAANPLYAYAKHWIATPEFLHAGHNVDDPKFTANDADQLDKTVEALEATRLPTATSNEPQGA